MKTRNARRRIWRELRHAYAALDTVPRDDENEMHRTIGRYYGLRCAYSVITGLPEDIIGQKVTAWYVESKHYRQKQES